MTSKRFVFVLALASVFSFDVRGTDAAPTTHTATKVVQSAEIASALTPLARVRAEQWGLSSVEWQRYEALMTGIRGSISPGNISPIEVLGIHARTEAERQDYAARWAKLMREDVGRILAFQRAYDEAGRRLFPEEKLIAEAVMPIDKLGAVGLSAQDRLLFFTNPNCAGCDTVLRSILRDVDRVDGIDIYLRGIADGDTGSVRAWAAQRGISPESVKRGRVTLNFDGGTLAKLGGGSATLPVILRRRADAITPIASSTFK